MAEKQIAQYADVARAAVRAAAVGKPVVAMSHVSGGLDQTIKGILDEGNVPFLQGTRESLVAIHHLVEYGRFLKRGRIAERSTGKSPQALPVILESLRGKRRVLGDGEAKKILQAYGIEIAREVLVQSSDEAQKAAKKIGDPVALKGLSPHIPHKTDAGLVRLNVRNGKELRAAYAQIQNSAKAFDPNAELEGILIQEMVSPDAAEILVGISRDSSFGPVIVLGLGGIWVELLADTALRLPPISSEDALEMISELKGKPLLEGFRGRPCVDVKSLAGVLVQIGRMAFDLKEVLISLDLNPLMVLPGERGVRVIDVVMEVGST
jgi:acyl-CoA synthetase (NDP forming)